MKKVLKHTMSAAAAGGRIIVPKQANNGVTAAVARKDML